MKRMHMNYTIGRASNWLFARKHWGLLSLVVLLLCLTSLVSCHHIQLYEPATGVYLKMDISIGAKTELAGGDSFPDKEMWNRIVIGNTPDVFRLSMYDRETGRLAYEDFIPAEGAFIEAPTGYYDIIITSMGAEAVRIDGMSSKGAARAYTLETGSAVKVTKVTKGNGDEADVNIQYPIHYMPDHVYVGVAEDVYIPVRSNITKAVSIELKLKTIDDTYTFEATNIEGAERIASLTCYITGQVTAKYLWDGRYPNELCALPVPVLVDKGGEEGVSTVRGVFNTLGKHPNALSNVFLNIMVQNAQGEYFQWIYDVTDQFHNPDNVKHEIVVSDRMIVPDAEKGGFTPSVGDWDAEIIDVPL